MKPCIVEIIQKKGITAWRVSKYGDISPYSVQMRENTDQKKLRIWTLFTQWMSLMITINDLENRFVNYISITNLTKNEVFNRDFCR